MNQLKQTLLISLISFSINAQHLDTIYPRSRNVKLDLLELSNGDYLFAGLKNLEPSLYQYTIIDQAGNVKDTLDLSYNDTNFHFDNCSSCLHQIGNTIFNAYTNAYSNDSFYVILSKLSLSTLDTISTQFYFGNSNAYKVTHAWTTEWDSDSTFLLSGLLARWTPDSILKYDLFLTKFDTAFNVLWETTVADSFQTQNYGPIGADIVIDDYGGILVTGSPYFHPPYEMGFAARFDKNGNKLWYKEYPATYGMSGMYCMDNGDGTYQYVQNTWSVANGGNNFLDVGRMDTMGNILSTTRLGHPQRLQMAQDLIRTKDGNFYVSGVSYYGNFHAFGMKFSPNGDSLWFRRYYHQDTMDATWVDSFHEDDDSNLVHVGFFADSYNAPAGKNNVYSWVYRTDQYGCNIEDCQISVADFASLQQLSIYPNPSYGEFWLNLPPESTGPLTLDIYSLNGSIMEKHTLSDRSEGKVKVVSRLSQGQYLCILKDADFKEIGFFSLQLKNR